MEEGRPNIKTGKMGQDSKETFVDPAIVAREKAFQEMDIEDNGLNDGSSGISRDCTTWGSKQIFKNLLVICIAFLCLFSAFQALSNIQSSINCNAGLGLASLSIIYGALVVSAILVPSIAIRLMGMKWTVSVTILCYAIYVAANFYPEWGTLIPTSALVGLAAAPLWASKSTYVTTIAHRYARISGNTSTATVNRFFGIFFLFFQTSQVLGNLESSLVLQQDRSEPVEDFICGSNDCPGVSNDTNYCNPPAKSLTYTLLGIYLGSALAAVAVVSIFLDKLQTSHQTRTENPCQLLLATVRLLKDYKMILLIPLTVYSGLEQAFITGDFTRSYITCTFGVGWVGYVMICYGLTDAVCSFIAGRLIKHVGRVPVFTFGGLVHIVLIFTLLFWVPSRDQLVGCFVIAACWGAADAVWQTQINALYGVLFEDRQEAGFSNYRLWESLGFTASFAYSRFLCVWVKLVLLVTVLVIGVGLYYVIEIAIRRKHRHTPEHGGRKQSDK